MSCVFCDIVSGKSPCHKIWEDEKHLAFLSIYPNTLVVTVVIPKEYHSSYAFEQSDEVLSDLIIATKKVALLLDKALLEQECFLKGMGLTIYIASYLQCMERGIALSSN